MIQKKKKELTPEEAFSRLASCAKLHVPLRIKGNTRRPQEQSTGVGRGRS
ncbi:MAG: hypothetical protein HXN19_08700 [Porphyromonas sp.]|nr:hypothetical protein [Porphyromonas sp.]